MKSKITNIKNVTIISFLFLITFLISYVAVFGQSLRDVSSFTKYTEIIQSLSMSQQNNIDSMDDLWILYCSDEQNDESIIKNGGFEFGFPENTELSSINLHPFVFCNWELSPLNTIPLSSLENTGFPFVFSNSAWPLDTRAVRLNLTQQASVFGGQNTVHQAHPFISSYSDIAPGNYDFNFTYSAINIPGYAPVDSFGLVAVLLEDEQMNALRSYVGNDIYSPDGTESIFGSHDYEYENVVNFFTENLTLQDEQFIHLSEINDISTSSLYENFEKSFVIENSYSHLVVMLLGYGPDFDMIPGEPAGVSVFVDDVMLSLNILGCTDPIATNFNSQANQDDGSCNYYGYFLKNITLGANQSSDNISISGDGTIIVFDSLASNLVSGDTNNQRDIFMAQYDLLSDSYLVTKLTQSYSGGNSNGQSRRPHVSDNGQYIVFESQATNLVEGLNPNPSHFQVYIYEIATGFLGLVTKNNENVLANNSSEKPRISPDGQYIVFESRADNLTEDALFAERNIFKVHRDSGVVSLVSKNSQNQPANGSSFSPDVSLFGQKVVFESEATNLVVDTSPAARNVFLKNIENNEVSLISEQGGGVSFGAGLLSLFPRISNNGEKIVFSSNVTDLVEGMIVGNNNRNIYLHSILEGGNSLVTFGASGVFSDSNSNNPDMSNDGLVVFQSTATNLVQTEEVQLPINNVFLFDGQEIVKLSIDQETGPGLQASQKPVISSNGKHVAFLSNAVNFPGGNSSISNVYVISFEDFEQCDLPYDLNNDSIVNIQDLTIFLTSFGTLCENGVECLGDFNGDALVNVVDLSLLLNAFGTDCSEYVQTIQSGDEDYILTQYVAENPQNKSQMMFVTEISGLRNTSNISLNKYFSGPVFTPRFSNSSKIRLDNSRQSYVIENIQPREVVRIYSDVSIPREACREPLFLRTELSIFCE